MQFPMVKHASPSAGNSSPRGSRRQRRGRANMLFPQVLEDKLRQFNPWLSRGPGSRDRREHRSAPAHHRGQPRGAALAARRTSVVRREREAPSSSPGRRLRQPRSECPPRHMGVEDRAARAGKGNRADVMFVVNGVPVMHRRAQEPKGRRRSDQGGDPATALREGDAGTLGSAAAPQRDAPDRLLVRRHLERQPPHAL